MTASPRYPFPLGELLHLLKSKGYDVSIENILQLQSILLTTSPLNTQPRELKYILAPLLAKNEEEQADLYHLVDDYIATKTKAEETPHKKLWLLIGKKKWFWLKLAGLLFVIITAVVFYVLQSTGKLKTNSVPTPTDSTRVEQPVKPSQSKQDQPVSTKPNDTSGKTSSGIQVSVRYSQPIKPERKNISLQISLFLGISLGAILFNLLFNERRKLLEKEETKKRISTGDVDKQQWSSADFGIEAEPLQNELEPVNLSFPSRNYLVQRTKEFNRIKATLKKPVAVEGQSLNIHKSMYATIRSAGFVKLQFDEYSRRQQFVALIEGNQDNHLTHLFDYFIHFLQAEKLPVRKFYFDKEITALTDEGGKLYTLDEISLQFNNHNLVVLGSGSCLFWNVAGEKRHLPSALRNWPHKYLITPTPLEDWGQLEDRLGYQGFQMVPAEIEAIELLTAAMLDQAVIPKVKILQKLKEPYSAKDYDLHSAGGIRKYLGDDHLFQMICALAVYPRLSWNLTLALMSAIGESWPQEKQQSVFNYNTILKIARIPFLQNDEIPPALRLDLLNQIKAATEVLAREAILRILKDIQTQIPQTSLAYTELDVQMNLNAFFLFAHDEWKYQAYNYTKKTITHYWEKMTDWEMKERVEQKLSGIMPLDALGKPQTISEYMIKEKEIEVMQLRLSKAYVLMLPALLLYILFSVFKPDFVFGGVKKVTVQAIIQKDPSCKEGFQYLEINGDKLISVTLQTGAKSQAINIIDVDPERGVGLKLIGNNIQPETVAVPAGFGMVKMSVNCRSSNY